MFQFPRLPRMALTTRARACPARVAPFGHPRISGRQRLPGAFRRVTASFLGRRRLGIPRAPFMRKPHAIRNRARKSLHVTTARTGSRQRGRAQKAHPRRAIPSGVRKHLPTPDGQTLPYPRPPYPARDIDATQCCPRQFVSYLHLNAQYCICVQCARATGHEPRRIRSATFFRPGKATFIASDPRPRHPTGRAWRIVKVHDRFTRNRRLSANDE
jgi:hypothetical protein